MKTTRSTVTFSAQALTRGRNRSRHRRSFYDTAIFGWAPLFALSLQKHFSLSLSKMFFIFSFFFGNRKERSSGSEKGDPPKTVTRPFFVRENVCLFSVIYIFSEIIKSKFSTEPVATGNPRIHPQKKGLKWTLSYYKLLILIK